MYVMKLSVLSSILFFSFLVGSVPDKQLQSDDLATANETIGEKAALQAFSVYPNPFKDAFYIVRHQGAIRNVTVLDEKGDGVAIEVIYWFRNIYVRVPTAPAGEYTVIVTYKDGSADSAAITKL